MSEEKKVEQDVAAEAPKAAQKSQKQYIRTAKGKKRAMRTVARGRVYITASNNNTIITVTDQNGNAIAWCSAGMAGFRGPKRSTPYAASIVANKIIELVEPYGLKEVMVYVKGIGSGRDSAIRSLNAKGLNISGIKELTPVPHNGCRSKRPRRV